MNWFKKLRYNTNNMAKENPQKVQDKVTELNKLTKGQEWIPAIGFHAMTVVEIAKAGQKPVFNPASGLIVRSFVNTTTGEIKSFAATLFLDEDDD